MHAYDLQPEEAPQEETLEELVARIKAQGPGPILSEPDPDAIRALAERVALEEPMTQEELDEWQHAWSAVEEEMRRIDLEDEMRDREDELRNRRMLTE